ncbi:MAG: Ig-like domain-containing protein, partial [Paludibacteraceae bacterium]
MESKKRTIKRRFLSVLTIILLFSAGLSAQTLDTNVPEGWAIYSGSNMTTTTGGGDGTVVTVKTLSDLSKYCGDSKPYVIFVEGTISGTDPVTVKSDKTIIGKAGSKLSGVGLSMSGASNIIIRNMNISGSADGIAARNTHHLWVDHCELWDNGDGLLDITNQSTYCTVSWCKFYYVNQTEHRLACLIGSGGGDHPEDFGYLRVTYHHNWYGNKVDQRQPRIMYGLGHVYNGYYTCSGNAYGIGVGSYGAALIENNYFKDMANPHYLMYNIYCWITARGNKYDNTTGSKANGKLGERDVVKEGSPEYTCDVKEFSEAPYLYTLDDVTKVPSLLTSGCAPKADFANIGMVPVPGQGAIEVSTTPKLQWVKGTSGRDATSYIVYLGTTTNPAKVATVTGQSYSPSKLQSGTVYYWRVDAVTPSGTIEGKLWRFKTGGTAPSNVAPTVSLTSPEDNATYSDGQVDLTLSATASDSDGSIWKVDFYNGTELLNTATHSPYGYVWKNVPEGTYTLTAVATDNEGLSTTSAAVTVVVRKPTTRIYQSEETDFWTTAQKWTPSVVPVASDTTIIRKGEVKSTGIDQTAPLSVEPEGVFRLVGDCTVDDMVLLGGVVRSNTSNPLFILTSNITVEENSTIWAGSVAASVFRIDGTISGSKNLEKTNVGVLNLNVDASGFSGVWTV